MISLIDSISVSFFHLVLLFIFSIYPVLWVSCLTCFQHTWFSIMRGLFPSCCWNDMADIIIWFISTLWLIITYLIQRLISTTR